MRTAHDYIEHLKSMTLIGGGSMVDLNQHKTCGMCRREIAADARKCPYCQHWQDKLSMALYHPGVIVLVLIVPLTILFIVFGLAFQRTFDRGEAFQPYASQIKVLQSSVSFGETQAGPTVVVTGYLQNTSPLNWKDVALAVEYYHADGQLIDSGQSAQYSYQLPVGNKVAFKLSLLREFPETDYASHTVHVISAKDASAVW